MSPTRTALLAAGLVALAMSPLAAKPMSDRAQKRAEAEHLCYADVQKLCNDAIPDEDKITACMKAKRTQLSPGCGKVFDAGLDGWEGSGRSDAP